MRFLPVAGAALAGVLAAAAAIPAQAATTPGWRTVFTKHYGAANDYSYFGSVLALAKNNAWALGGDDASDGDGTTQGTVAEHWNGKTWSSVAMPSGTSSYVDAAAATSASSIWATTYEGGDILHWNGSKWSVSKHLVDAGVEFTGVTAISATNVWVFGGPGADPGFGTYHYDGKTWQQEKTASDDGIESAGALSATNMWAIGSGNAGGDSIFHYNGKIWQHVTASALSGSYFVAIQAYGASNVWVAANGGTATSTGFVVHYNGKTWTRYKLPWAGAVLRSFTPDGHGGLWMTASQLNANGISAFYLVHRTSSGAWSRVGTSVNARDVDLIPGSSSALFGVGGIEEKTGGDAAILAYGTLP
jgi:hypothetical protein